MVPQILPTELTGWLQSAREQQPGQLPVVLDVREEWEVQTASVRADGFRLVCIPMGQIVQRLAELDKNESVACLCHHGARSQRVAAYLMDQDYAQVVNISGGIHAWSLQLDPGVPRY